VPGARSLALSPSGVLYVGTQEGKVYALVDRDRDGRADRVYTVAEGLHTPNGVAVKNGALYVAEISQVLRFDAMDEHLEHPGKPVAVGPAFPSDRAHGWKFIRFGPDGKLYVPVGAPCNICEIKDPYASITRMGADGAGREIYARGIRNTVGFDWQPGTGVLWFTDNGRDWLGDDSPPDELDRAPHAGLHFGYPFCHGGDLPDPKFGAGHPCSQFTPPAIKLGPHVAALGMRFYTGSMFPAEYKNQIFLAEHGSWNRSSPIGYRVSLVKVSGSRAVSYQPFVDGWLAGGHEWGRPVDVEVAPDGALLVSDDKAGAIYRIAYSGAAR
jgi:glucose/arabinose dehydrogenase